uniref:Uncharacterized protein n=1 Tax=Romanomermis culicivorax TaxID=13658 RepID=A0A915L3D9_ROMCU
MVILFISSLPQMMKQSGAVLKNPLLCVRYRLYKALISMNPKNFEALFSLLLRELVADFTLTDNVNVILSTVYEFSQFNHQGSAHLRYCFEDSDHRMIENKVLFDHHSCIGALENDIYELCDRDRDMESPNSFPTHVSLIDASIILFGVMFPNVPNKHKIQMLDHFNECVKQAKGPKEQVIRTNIALALLTSLKAMTDNKSTLDNENVIRSINAFFDEHLSSPNATLRFCSGDGMGRLTHLVADPRFLTRIVDHCFQK